VIQVRGKVAGGLGAIGLALAMTEDGNPTARVRHQEESDISKIPIVDSNPRS
jgi:hypothetical protein